MNTKHRIGRAAGALLLGLGAATAVSAAPPPARATETSTAGDVVVKVFKFTGCSVDNLLKKFEIDLVSTLLGSARIYLVRWTDPALHTASKGDDLAKKLKGLSCVDFAERNREVSLSDARYHSWPDGTSRPSSEKEWRSQSSSQQLGLSAARALSTGSGIKVAVLDTGVDLTHPVFGGRAIAGWDYVDDDPDSGDEPGGIVTGHGTFIAGVVHMVAPGAKIIAMRVLDADGVGNGYVIAQAIRDAVRLGAKVINLSLGTTEKLESKVLTDVIKWARSKGAITVAAAGNDGDEEQHWPAAQPEVVSVAALDPTNTALAPYSTRGGWVDVATIGTDLISAMPGGGYDAWSGTSMATPVVAGQLALLKSVRPKLDPKQIEDRVRETSRKVKGAHLRYGAIDIPASIVRALK